MRQLRRLSCGLGPLINEIRTTFPRLNFSQETLVRNMSRQGLLLTSARVALLGLFACACHILQDDVRERLYAWGYLEENAVRSD